MALTAVALLLWSIMLSRVTILLLAALAATGCTVDPVRRFGESYENVSAAAFSHDGRFLAATSRVKAVVRVWDVESGAELASRQDERTKERDFDKQAIAFSPDGTAIAYSSPSGRITRWNWRQTEAVVSAIEHPSPVAELTYSPDGRQLISVSGGYITGGSPTRGRPLHVVVEDVASGMRIGGFADPADADTAVTHAALSPDGSLLAYSTVSGLLADQPKFSLRLRGAQSGAELAVLNPDAGTLAFNFSSDGRRVHASIFGPAAGPGVRQVWSLADGQLLSADRAEGVMPMGAFLSANGEKLITLERGREPNLLSLAAPPLRFRVTDLANGQSRPGPQMNSRDGRDAYVRAVSPDRLFYIDQRLRLWKGPE